MYCLVPQPACLRNSVSTNFTLSFYCQIFPCSRLHWQVPLLWYRYLSKKKKYEPKRLGKLLFGIGSEKPITAPWRLLLDLMLKLQPHWFSINFELTGLTRFFWKSNQGAVCVLSGWLALVDSLGHNSQASEEIGLAHLFGASSSQAAKASVLLMKNQSTEPWY